MSVDANGWRSFDKTLKFTGDKGEFNNFLFSSRLWLEDTLYNSIIRMRDYDINGFIPVLDSMINVMLGRREQYERDSKDWNSSLNNITVESGDFIKIGSYAIYGFNCSMQESTESATKLIKNLLPDLNYKNSALSSHPECLEGLDAAFEILIEKNEFKNPESRFVDKIRLIDHYIEPPVFKRNIAVHQLENYIFNNPWNSGILQQLEKVSSNDLYQILASRSSNYRLFGEGLDAPEFELFDSLGTKYKLSDFAEQFLYIDVWASYCGPCLKEVPFFEGLKHEFAGLNIEFISISLDRKEGDWKKCIQKYGMTGNQLIAKNDWSSDFARNYYINSFEIPYYLLISPDGKIVKIQAPKPSEAEEFLRTLLQ